MSWTGRNTGINIVIARKQKNKAGSSSQMPAICPVSGSSGQEHPHSGKDLARTTNMQLATHERQMAVTEQPTAFRLSTFHRNHVSHHHHFPPWIRSLDLFRHRRVAIVSWGVHDFFFLWVCIWGRVSEVWCCPFLRDGWSRFVCIWISRLVFPRPLVLFLWLVWSCISFDTS